MRMGFPMVSGRNRSLLSSIFASAFALVFFVLTSTTSSHAFPAFARKYGLPCSACHEAWPMLNVFGQTFKDNGYQLMNDRDSPIWQNPSYWPVTFRITPNWHRESVNRVAVDTSTGPGTGTGEVRITSHGFDLSGLDILSGGTLYNNISFLLVPSVDSVEESIGIESAWGRFDNLAKSPWLNVKMGKFEFDNIISEKRGLTLSGAGGPYQLYHFIPFGDNNVFAQIGDNQLGVEWMGHSVNDRSRASVAVVSSNDGTPGLQSGNAYSTFVTGSQAFNAGYQGGVDRVGAFVYAGKAPTFFRTSGGDPVPGSGIGNKGFHREGVFALLYAKKLDFQLYYQHGWDSPYFGTATAANAPLPAGAKAPTWNGAFVETHWVQNIQLIFFQRSEWIRMSQQAIAGTRSDLGNIDNYVFGVRWYPIMFSRAGVALHGEYGILKQVGTAPDGVNDLTSSSIMAGFDFDF
jgi:hypothetical protein